MKHIHDIEQLISYLYLHWLIKYGLHSNLIMVDYISNKKNLKAHEKRTKSIPF